jgi:hypothetical protein
MQKYAIASHILQWLFGLADSCESVALEFAASQTNLDSLEVSVTTIQRRSEGASDLALDIRVQSAYFAM